MAMDATVTAFNKVLPMDTLSEAGCKVLLTQFTQNSQLKTESDEEKSIREIQLHVQHVQSALRLIKFQSKPIKIRPYRRSINNLSSALNAIQHLDDLIDDLNTFGATLDSDHLPTLQAILERLNESRNVAFENLGSPISKKQQRHLEKLLKRRLGKSESISTTTPSQVRHVLPELIYRRLSVIQAYDHVITEVNHNILQELRFAFRRLHEAVDTFEPILGKQITDFNIELQSIQNTLKQIDDTLMARNRLNQVINIHKKKYAEILDTYFKYLNEKESVLVAKFKEQWDYFNSRKVQQKLSTALLTLYEN